MALVRVYCGLASAEPATQQGSAEVWLTVAVVDDAGRLLDICDISDDAAGYAELGEILAERSSGPASVAVAADSDDHIVTQLLTAAGRYLAYTDDDSADDYAERFADDESVEEIESTASERRAIGLARALQAGVLSAVAQATPRDLMSLKPVLAAQAAVTSGRQGAAGTLREVLRELYPAALRAYPDPAEPLPLAVLEALPEPGLLGTGASGRNRDAQVVSDLTAAGVGDEVSVAEAVTALRVAIAETPRRTGINRAVTAAVADTIRQVVAAVRACDSASEALVGVLAERMAATSSTQRPARGRLAGGAKPSAAPLRAVRESGRESARESVRESAPEPARTSTAPRRGRATQQAAPAARADSAYPNLVVEPTGRPVTPVPSAISAPPASHTAAPQSPGISPIVPIRQPAATPAAASAPAAQMSPAPVPGNPPMGGHGPQVPAVPAPAGHAPAAPAASAGHAPYAPAAYASAPLPTRVPSVPPVRGPLPPMSAPPMSAPPMSAPPMSAPPLSHNPRSHVPVSSMPVSSMPVSAAPVSSTPVSSSIAPPASAPPAQSRPAQPAPAQSRPPQSPAASYGQPLPNRPVSSQPVSSQPVSSQPLPNRPVSSQPVSSQPVSSQPMSGQPMSAQPASGRPVSGVPVSARPGFGGDLRSSEFRPATNGRQPSDYPTEYESESSRPMPGVAPPGSRSTWPLVGDPLHDTAEALRRDPYDRPSYSPPSLDLPADPVDPPRVEVPRQREGRVTPPWQADDLPAEPPALRLVEPAPLADPALERDLPYRDDLDSDDVSMTPPDLRLVEPAGGQSPWQTGPQNQHEPEERASFRDGGLDGDLLIFAATRSAWFTDRDDEASEVDWSTPADLGWRAAEQAARPAVGAETISGLPKRVPQQNLVPGSPIGSPERPLRIVRDAASIAAHTTGYFRGWRRGQEVGGYAVGGRPGRESAGGWEFSRDNTVGYEGNGNGNGGGRDYQAREYQGRDYDYRSAHR